MSDTSTDTSYRVTADELRQFIERIERLDAEKKDLAEQQKEAKEEIIVWVPTKQFKRTRIVQQKDEEAQEEEQRGQRKRQRTRPCFC